MLCLGVCARERLRECTWVCVCVCVPVCDLTEYLCEILCVCHRVGAFVNAHVRVCKRCVRVRVREGKMIAVAVSNAT